MHVQAAKSARTLELHAAFEVKFQALEARFRGRARSWCKSAKHAVNKVTVLHTVALSKVGAVREVFVER
jgi:hypothetical protein